MKKKETSETRPLSREEIGRLPLRIQEKIAEQERIEMEKQRAGKIKTFLIVAAILTAGYHYWAQYSTEQERLSPENYVSDSVSAAPAASPAIPELPTTEEVSIYADSVRTAPRPKDSSPHPVLDETKEESSFDTQEPPEKATDKDIYLSGKSFTENTERREEQVKKYKEEIISLIDSFITSGLEYRYAPPETVSLPGNENSIYIYLPGLKASVKKSWLEAASTYQEKLIDEDIYRDAIELIKNDHLGKKYDSRSGYDGVLSAVSFVFDLQDAQGKILASVESRNYIGGRYNDKNGISQSPPYIYFRRHFDNIQRLAGLFDSNSSYRHKNISDEQRIFSATDDRCDKSWSVNIRDYCGRQSHGPVIGPIDRITLAKIEKITIRAVKIKDYGGNIPLYESRHPSMYY